jgi:L,D-transpeptidase ErfK/SrfK
MLHHPLSRREFCAGFGTSALGVALFGAMPRAWAAATEGGPYPGMAGTQSSIIARYEDTLVDLAREYGLGFTELRAANPGVDTWLPGKGTKILLPTGHLLPNAPREGLVLNLADQRVYYFAPGGSNVESYPIGAGREAWDTPVGSTSIVRKKRNPSWYVPKSIREEDPTLPAVVRPGPDNPLGKFAMYLGWRSYLIHGTNSPWGVGRRVSHGCIRMYPEDIAQLFPRIPTGTPVTVVNQQVKIGRVDGELMIEIHPGPKQSDEIEAEGKFTPQPLPELAYMVVTAAGDKVKMIDWSVVNRAARERHGVPVRALKAGATASAS